MAQFNGFLCDSCDNVFPMAQRVKKTTKYDGPDVQGEVHQDLCPSCAVAETEDIGLKPLRRRGKGKDPEVLGDPPAIPPVEQPTDTPSHAG